MKINVKSFDKVGTEINKRATKILEKLLTYHRIIPKTNEYYWIDTIDNKTQWVSFRVVHTYTEFTLKDNINIEKQQVKDIKPEFFIKQYSVIVEEVT